MPRELTIYLDRGNKTNNVGIYLCDEMGLCASTRTIHPNEMIISYLSAYLERIIQHNLDDYKLAIPNIEGQFGPYPFSFEQYSTFLGKVQSIESVYNHRRPSIITTIRLSSCFVVFKIRAPDIQVESTLTLHIDNLTFDLDVKVNKKAITPFGGIVDMKILDIFFNINYLFDSNLIAECIVNSSSFTIQENFEEAFLVMFSCVSSITNMPYRER